MNSKKTKILFVICFFSILLSNNLTKFNFLTSTISHPQTLPQNLIFCGVFPILDKPNAGPDRRDGFLMAVDEINSQVGVNRILPTGVNITPVVYDDGNSAAGGITAANNCIGDNAHIVIGTSGSTVSKAMHDVLKLEPLVQISYASSNPELSNRTQYPFFMRVTSSENEQGRALADLIESFGFAQGAIISGNDSFHLGIADALNSSFSGEIVSSQIFNLGAGDFTSQMLAINNSNPEFIVLNSYSASDATTILKNAISIGLTNNPNIVWFITIGSFESSTFTNESDVKSAMQYNYGLKNEIKGPNYETFNNSWFSTSTCGNELIGGPISCAEGRKGSAFDFYTPLAYDAVFVAAKGFANAVTIDPTFAADNSTLLLEELYKINHEGTGKNITFDSLGEVSGLYNLLTLNNETFETVGKWQGTLTFSVSYLLSPGRILWNVSGTTLQLVTHSISTPLIIYPNGGEVLNETLNQIRWQEAIDSHHVLDHSVSYDIYYSLDNGSNWNLITSNLTDFNYNWNISSLLNGDNYLVRVIAYDENGLNITNVSDSVFSINIQEAASTSEPSTGSSATFDEDSNFIGNIDPSLLLAVAGGVIISAILIIIRSVVQNRITSTAKSKVRKIIKKQAGFELKSCPYCLFKSNQGEELENHLHSDHKNELGT
ncbi:MAG: ABC transporter substrate-binding protein [Candidatus Hodarchaeales archaeon]